MPIEIRPFEDSLWPVLSRFLHEHWQPSHPLCQRDLFYWQYQGFGPQAGTGNCRLLVDGDTIHGFLGAIPGLYRLDGRDVPGMALALWVVIEQLRNSGLGILLMREVEKLAPVTVCLGVNPKVVRYYTATGYKHLPALHRYVCPLQAEAYQQLLSDPTPLEPIAAWTGLALHGADAIDPTAIDPAALADLWLTMQDRWRLALCRTQDFWTWRYRDAVGFDYVQFARPGQGAIIARMDRIASADNPTLEAAPILRIIEILPAGNPSDPAAVRAASRLLAGALSWAASQGAIAADFQCASTRLAPILELANLRTRSQQPALANLPELFNPLRRAAAPINLMVKAAAWPDPDLDAIYCVKSDGDMDRPTRWPPTNP